MTFPKASIIILLREIQLSIDPELFKTQSSFQVYAKVECFQQQKTSKEITIEANKPIPVFNEELTFSTEIKKIFKPFTLTFVVEVFQKTGGWFSSKEQSLGKIECLLHTLPPDGQSLDYWFPFSRGAFHLQVTKKNLNTVYPVSQVTQAYYGQTPQASYTPFPQQFYAPPVYQQQSIPQQYPSQSTSIYPNLQAYNPNYTPDENFDQIPNNSNLPQQVPNYNAKSNLSQQVPNYTSNANFDQIPNNSNLPQQVPNNIITVNMNQDPNPDNPKNSVDSLMAPILPPKVSLPEEINNKTVVANFNFATQPVTETILTGYLKFCGEIKFIEIKDTFALVTFSQTYERDIALLLDNGNVCGGPILIFPYSKLYANVTEPTKRKKVEEIAKNLVARVKSNPEQFKSEEKLESKIEEQNVVEIEKGDSNSIFVSNLSPKVTSELLSDFFSYCGEIKNCTLHHNKSSPTQVAAVHFTDEKSTQSALLLDSALIYDLQISVVPLTPQLESQLKKTQQVSSSQSKPSKTSGEKTQSSIVASLLANGYSIGSSVASKAKTIDTKYELSKKAQNVFSGVKDALGFKKE